ncbi:MAG: AtpZ/AtpI family protein [Alphaproteobacteria bacterium]|nr:AtpZ/AtpI family protein [Alphaproteobacteria bacterium]
MQQRKRNVPMVEDERPPSLDDLENRIQKARAAHSAAGAPSPRPSPVGQALRLAVEMASALFVGAGLGWLLDKWLGTGPWFLLVCLLLGGVGGMLNVYRTGKRLGAPSEEERTGRDGE